MPTYDVTFKVFYKRTARVEAGDEDSACEQAHELVRADVPREAQHASIDLYSCEVARKDDDA